MGAAAFPIVEVTADAPVAMEPLGTKPKFWFDDEKGRPCLWKEVRPGTLEDWAEKIACELCRLLGLPHAEYELATWKGKHGVVSPTFVPQHGRLVLGNELLVHRVQGYDPTRKYRASQHTLPLVLRLLDVLSRHVLQLPMNFSSAPAEHSAVDVFLGYLHLDAWIGNQDRHHENWGLVLSETRTVHLAPTFDHASSLGCHVLDTERDERLNTRDRGRSIEHYAARAKSAFFANSAESKAMSTLDAFGYAAQSRRAAAKYWLDRLKSIADSTIDALFERVPASRINPSANRFGIRMLAVNRERLLDQFG